jgi:hypothetical protein
LKGAIVGTAAERSFKFLGVLVQKAGPYLLLELLLPGGTLFALLLYVYRRSRPLGASASPRDVLLGWIRMVRVEAFVVPLSDIASLWRGRHRERDGLEAMAIAPIA